jgi:hypothetical protein
LSVATDDEINAIQSNAATAEEEQNRVAESTAYADTTEIFDRETKKFTLEDDVMSNLVSQVKALPSNKTIQGVPDGEIKDIIINTLGLEDNEFFNYGFLDFADEDGEVGVKSLISELRKLAE